jgi:DNA-binding NarL/FixJ family response regulator
MERTRKVLIVEDEAFVSDALVELLATAHGFVVIGVAARLRDARRLLVEHAPDIIVADLFLDDGSTVELLRDIRERHLGTRVVILTGVRDAFAANEALAAGAFGYVLKLQPARELLGAIEKAALGQHYVSPQIAVRLAAGPTTGSNESSGLGKLSRREVEVLRQIAAGHTSAEIARRLCISTKTIDTHRSNMYRKLSLRNAVDLMRFATVHGIGLAAPAAASSGPADAAPEPRQRQLTPPSHPGRPSE